VLQRKLRDRQKLEKKLEKASADLEKVISDVDLATKRSRQLEEELDKSRKKERELKTVNMKLREMQNDLSNANSKLKSLEKSLDSANKKWMRKPRDHIEVDVQRGSSHQEVTHNDIKGRHIDADVRVKTLDYSPPAKADSKKDGTPIREGDSLRFAIGDLERRTDSYDKKNQDILTENNKLANEIRIMKQAMVRLGFTITKEPLSAGGSGLKR